MRYRTLLAALVLILAIAPCLAVMAATPTFSVSATLDKPAYYVGETPSLTVELSWSDLSQDYTMKYVVCNSTGDEVATLDASVSVTGSTDPEGSATETYSLAASIFTSEVGEETYELRVIDTASGLTVASASFTVRVKSEEIRLSVAWEDASGDRLIEPLETVEFKVFITWAFVNASKTLALYADSQLVDNVAVSAGSGSAQKTWLTTFDSEGTHSVTFRLEDSAGKVVAQKAVAVTVGRKLTEKGASIIEQGVAWVKQNAIVIIILLGLVLVALIVLKHR
ncbi:hypothetical protein DRO58_04850 [Candidatus Bathyarchaeota archaeon]|nr:MAG: hypothetical protein DRO58_04850 [Candidatus Bathyarchaeota archaeon]